MSLSVPAHLTAERWRCASSALLAKMLQELAYERLLEPVETRSGQFRVDLPGAASYEFAARRGAFDSWRVDAESVRRCADGTVRLADDPLLFLLDARSAIGLDGDTAGHFFGELSATLTADTRLLEGAPTTAELADLPYPELEGHQTGHPWLVANKGRIGFSASDAAQYAPESREPQRLSWIAVHRTLAAYRAVDGLTANRLIEQEIDSATRERFTEALARRTDRPADYSWLPVHPWQWDNVVVPLFASELASNRIVPLGDGPDRYLSQQSVRTFTNVDRPLRHHVKLPLSILNTLVWRGLPTERTLAAPAVTTWIHGIAGTDAFLRDEARPVLLGEVASVTVRHPWLEHIPDVPYQYQELLGAIWREPIAATLEHGERARTLAALLHVDSAGRSLVAELVSRSGLDPQSWLRRLLAALLPPLLHFLYRYGVVFSPHGENTIVVYDEVDRPVRLAVKDFVDDVNVSGEPLPELEGMPQPVASVLLRESPQMLCQFIQSGLLVGVFRYLAPLAEDHLGVPEAWFWASVREQVLAYQARFPDLADRFDTFDLLAPDLNRLCLNRNRLLLDGYRDRPERPHAAVHGTVPNPLHASWLESGKER